MSIFGDVFGVKPKTPTATDAKQAAAIIYGLCHMTADAARDVATKLGELQDMRAKNREGTS